MASVSIAGIATVGVQVTSDNTGILELKTGTGSGTTAVTIGTDQSVTFAGAVSSSGNQTVSGNLTVNGNTTLGDANTDTILMTAAPSIGGAGLGMGFGFRNRIINGGMVIDQRGSASSPINNSASVNTYITDRFALYGTSATKMSGQQSTTTTTNFVNSLLITSSAATTPAAGDAYGVRQVIEGTNIGDLNWGTANASTVTLSFWVRSSITGTYALSLFNRDSPNRSYVATYTINSANTFEYKTITIAGETTGTWLTTTGQGIQVWWDLGSGSNFNTTAGVWQSSLVVRTSGSANWIGTNGATFYITGVQLEKGSTATSFDYRPYTTELQLCQRYCYAMFASDCTSDNYTRFGMGDCDLTTRVQTITWFPVTMRAVPSLTATAANTFTAYSAGNTYTLTAIAVAPTITPKVGTTDGTTSGLTAGRSGQIIANNNRTAYLIYSAEL